MQKRIGYNSRRQEGFTLIEMMLALVLTALVCGWATYGLYTQSKKAALQRAGYSVYHGLRTARTLACKEYRLCVFEMDFTNQRFRIRSLQGDIPVSSFVENPENPQEKSFTLEKEFQLPERVRFYQLLVPDQSPLQNGVQQISFYPQGTATAAVIQLRNEEDCISLQVFPQTARVELFRGVVETLPADQVEIPARGKPVTPLAQP